MEEDRKNSPMEMNCALPHWGSDVRNIETYECDRVVREKFIDINSILRKHAQINFIGLWIRKSK